MHPTLLDSHSLSAPWTLWTCHLVHRDLEHALGNALAVALPLLLCERGSRLRTGLWLVLLAPVASLALLPFLGSGTHQGVSALACALWVLVGLRLCVERTLAPLGAALLGLLAVKFAVEAATGAGLVVHTGRWQALEPAHLIGAVLGLAAGALDRSLARGMMRLRREARSVLTAPR